MQAASVLQLQAPGLGDWLQKLRSWVLAEPVPAALEGQCCDRLRPRFVAAALKQELPRQLVGKADLVDWQWDSSTGQVRGLLLNANQLQRFHWVPGLEQFRLQPIAELRLRSWPLRLLHSLRRSPEA